MWLLVLFRCCWNLVGVSFCFLLLVLWCLLLWCVCCLLCWNIGYCWYFSWFSGVVYVDVCFVFWVVVFNFVVVVWFCDLLGRFGLSCLCRFLCWSLVFRCVVYWYWSWWVSCWFWLCVCGSVIWIGCVDWSGLGLSCFCWWLGICVLVSFWFCICLFDVLWCVWF